MAVALVAAAVGVGAAALVLGQADDDGDGSVEAAPGDETTSTSVGPEPAPEPAGVSPAGDSQDGDWAALFDRARSGVVRIRASSCEEGTGAGTGFLIDGDRVATAAHVVSGAVAVSVETESGTYRATIEGIDESGDLASLRLSSPDPGHVFEFASADPDPGTSVAVIGHPLDGPLSISQGTVSGVHRTVDTGGGPLSGLLQTDAAVNPGNSGGPVLTASGDVAGVLSGAFSDYEGLGFAVESSTAEPWFAAQAGGPPASPVGCPAPLGPRVTGDISVPQGGEWAMGVDPSLGPEPGESCTNWSLDYVLLEQADGRFLIDEVTGHGGTSGHVSCL